jgi:adenine deaminase
MRLKMNELILSGNIVDVVNKRIFPGKITVKDGVIASITSTDKISYPHYIMPGFIDAHVHIESSMMIPSEFARLAVTHGTVATISDPHEIGNVMGVDGVRYMIRNGNLVPFHFYFGAPSCVPATSFETAGATIAAQDIRSLFEQDKLKYLSEMMNYPGVLERSPLVMDKIKIAQEFGVPVDGHAPGLKGTEAQKYISAGISTDHECYTLEEAQDKLQYGMKILIREGSAAKNYDALHPILKSHPESVMFCSDDKHPNELVEGHINQLVVRSIVKHGYDTMDVLRCACYNPVVHYKLDVGLLQKGDSADFIVVDNLNDFNVLQTYIKGQLVAEKGKTLIDSVKSEVINHFNITKKKEADFKIQSHEKKVRVIGALEGQLITKKLEGNVLSENGYLESNIHDDILKLAVINRYNDSPVALGFIHGFGLKDGAFASCIAHDSHNIIAVGTNDSDLCKAVNAIIENKGGISVASQQGIEVLPLPIAGIMAHQDGYQTASSYALIDKKVKKLGTTLHAPFMTLAFMALLVIPSLKLSDKGLFDADAFAFTPLIIK